jgi:hypothetical protein
MKLVPLSLDQFFDSQPHLLDKVPVKLTVKVITLILVYSFDAGLPTLLTKVFFDNADDCFFHLFLHNVIFSRSIDFIEELLLALLKSVLTLLFAALTVSLFLLELRGKKVVVLFCQRLYS